MITHQVALLVTLVCSSQNT